VAKHLGVTSGPAVSQQIAQYRELLKKSSHLKKLAARCEAALLSETV